VTAIGTLLGYWGKSFSSAVTVMQRRTETGHRYYVRYGDNPYCLLLLLGHGEIIYIYMMVPIKFVGEMEQNIEFWQEPIDYCPFIRHGSHRKRRDQQFFYCCMCIRCRCNVFTEPLPSNDRGIHIQAQRLKGVIHEVRH
jgi:hypothetical protein